MKIVVAAYGSRGDVEPAITVAAELLRRGHDVRMAVTVPSDLRNYVESVGLASVPYGRDWQELLSDEDFTHMLQNPLGALPQAVEYVAQVVAEKHATLVSLTDDADLLVAGVTEQVPAANVAEYRRIPLAVLHFFPSQILQSGSPQDGATTHADLVQRRALGLPDDSELSALEIQAYDGLCLPKLADEWSEDTSRPFVGALTLELPTDTDHEVLAWAAAGPPPIYFGFGSTPVAEPAEMVAVIGAACARVGARALICLGPHHSDGIAHPEHVKVVRDINHAMVFPACSAVVHHGGAGTTAAGLRSGTPTLILCNGLDQPMWAAAVTHLGVGFGRRFSEATLDSLTADLREILAPQYAERSREVAGQMTTAAESLTRTVELLEAATRPKP
jgi:vancomycin aglycone glucosyltransferase